VRDFLRSPILKQITLYSRTGCHLCEVAREEIERISADMKVAIAIEEITIDGDPDLEREYGFMVPVIHIDGAMHGYGRVEEARLRRALS
jgi:glutaredoxin